MAFIFGSPLHVKSHRASRHRPDSNTLLGTFMDFQGTAHRPDSNTLLGTFMDFQSMAHIYQYIGDYGQVQSAHHAVVVNELCVHRLPHDPLSPASKALLDYPAGNQSVGAHTTLALRHTIEDLIPSCTKWLPLDMAVTEISDLLPDEAHDLQLEYLPDLARCEITGIDPYSVFGRRLTKGPTQLLHGRILLQINVNAVQTVNDPKELFDGYVSATHGRLSLSDTHDPQFIPGVLTNLTILSVKKPRANGHWKDDFSFGAADISMLRSGFTISGLTSHPASQCPHSFHEAVRGPFKGD